MVHSYTSFKVQLANMPRVADSGTNVQPRKFGKFKIALLILTICLIGVLGIVLFVFVGFQPCPKGYVGENCDQCDDGYYINADNDESVCLSK